MNKNIDSRLFPSSDAELNFKFKKEQMVGFLLFEIKGIIDSMDDMSGMDEMYDHPSLERLKKRINQAIEVFTSVGESDSGAINFEK